MSLPEPRQGPRTRKITKLVEQDCFVYATPIRLPFRLRFTQAGTNEETGAHIAQGSEWNVTLVVGEQQRSLSRSSSTTGKRKNASSSSSSVVPYGNQDYTSSSSSSSSSSEPDSVWFSSWDVPSYFSSEWNACVRQWNWFASHHDAPPTVVCASTWSKSQQEDFWNRHLPSFEQFRKERTHLCQLVFRQHDQWIHEACTTHPSALPLVQQWMQHTRARSHTNVLYCEGCQHVLSSLDQVGAVVKHCVPCVRWGAFPYWLRIVVYGNQCECAKRIPSSWLTSEPSQMWKLLLGHWELLVRQALAHRFLTQEESRTVLAQVALLVRKHAPLCLSSLFSSSEGNSSRASSSSSSSSVYDSKQSSSSGDANSPSAFGLQRPESKELPILQLFWKVLDQVSSTTSSMDCSVDL